MKFKFTQAVHLGGKDYGRGVHDLPEAVVKDNKTFLQYVKLGYIKEAGEGEMVKPESLQERNKRLAEKLTTKAPVTPSAPMQSPPPPQEEAVLPAVSEEFPPESDSAPEEMEAPAKKSFNKKKR